jgi:hypothetical protein
MAIKFTNSFHCQTLENLPKLVFLVWKYTVWQPFKKAASYNELVALAAWCSFQIVQLKMADPELPHRLNTLPSDEVLHFFREKMKYTGCLRLKVLVRFQNYSSHTYKWNKLFNHHLGIVKIPGLPDISWNTIPKWGKIYQITTTLQIRLKIYEMAVRYSKLP